MTRYGAVETRQEGWKYAEWLKSHEGEYDGVIMSLPNFSDENGAVAAVRDAGTPIFIIWQIRPIFFRHMSSKDKFFIFRNYFF